MKNLIMLSLIIFYATKAVAQNHLWEAKDKQKLVENYKRAFKELNDETASLSKKQ